MKTPQRAALFTLLSIFLTSLASAYEPAGGGEVAILNTEWRDANRDRAVPAKIYYPKTGANLPVIIFSHGLGGSREGYAYLGKAWAGAGFVSVHLQHIGSDDAIWRSGGNGRENAQQSVKDPANAFNRPIDVSFAIDELGRMNADAASPLYGRLDLDRIGVAGHSFGAWTALAVAGQTSPFSRFTGGKGFRDPRVKAMIEMSAPAPMIRKDLDAAYAEIKIPTMHMTGTKDFLEAFPDTKASDRRIPYDHIQGAESSLVIFNGGDHMIFSGRVRTGSEAEQEQDAVFQKLIAAGTTAFWDAYLKGDAGAKKWLLDGGYATLLGNQATFEHK
jgi:predicted dienelactone hydrolase